MVAKVPGVYSITDRYGDVYIGSTVNLYGRWRVHEYDLKRGRHHSKSLQKVFDDHGLKELDWKVLDYCAEEDLLRIEQNFLDTLKPRHNTYLTAGSAEGAKWSQESIEKMRSKLKGRKISEETLKKRSVALKGRTFSEDHRKKLSLSFPKCAPVRCIETGEVFRSTLNAVRWIRESMSRPTASNSMIIKVCRGTMKAAYGYKWEYMEKEHAGE